ncbi:hypothetical protein [Microbulbifer mangrovi]|uniref:hypothetical protein n=1 Tax=Microbulbifer mangrovi TaxID=927787 RepID=UPI00099097F9|nr:hypothetical protein [Microbulbifer mangrovi]
MDFPKTISIEACEQFLAKLNESPEQILQLPVDTSAPAFGGLASAIQASNTWMRYAGQRKLLLRSSTSRDVLLDINERPHKFSAAMCATSIAMADNPEDDLRREVNLRAKFAIEEQGKSPFGQQRGRLCWFAFVDHSSKAFDRNFYIEKPGSNAEPRQPEQIRAVIKAMIDKSMGIAGGAKSLSGDALECIGRLFFELFLNTHEHGSRGESRTDWLRPGLRILYVQGVNLSQEGSDNITEKQPALHQYVASTKAQGMRDQKRFVEVGIVDSGLGYCGRWLADHDESSTPCKLTIEEEYRIFKKCYQFRQTSTQLDSKGNGLPVVMDRLTRLGGFIRVRSGRLALYRNFIDSPYQINDECGFYDWVSGNTGECCLTTMPSCVGVSTTLLIPLEAKS